MIRGEEPWVRTRILPPRPRVPGREQCRPKQPRPGVPGRGQCRPKIPTRPPTGWHRRLLTLLANTQQTIWCCSRSPRPIFRSGPLRRLSLTACHILARSSTLWLKGQRFLKTIAQFSSSCHQTKAQIDPLVEACATLTPLFGTERIKMLRLLALVPNSRIIPQ